MLGRTALGTTEARCQIGLDGMARGARMAWADKGALHAVVLRTQTRRVEEEATVGQRALHEFMGFVAQEPTQLTRMEAARTLTTDPLTLRLLVARNRTDKRR